MDKLTIILKNDECIERIAEAFTLELDECDNLRIRSIRDGQQAAFLTIARDQWVSVEIDEAPEAAKTTTSVDTGDTLPKAGRMLRDSADLIEKLYFTSRGEC